eukprot:scpid88272/ scgid24044/ 
MAATLLWSSCRAINLCCKLVRTQKPSHCMATIQKTSGACTRSLCLTREVRSVQDDGSLHPEPPQSPAGAGVVLNRASPVEQKVDPVGVPDQAPYGLTVLHYMKHGYDCDDLMKVFEADNPTEVAEIGCGLATMHFSCREDLIAALSKSNTSEVCYLRLRPSRHLRYLPLIGDNPPYRAYLSRLPPGSTESSLYKLFKDLKPVSCLQVRTRRDGELIAFMSFSERSQLLVALERSGTNAVQGTSVRVAIKPEEVRRAEAS